ncbi:hypothetical protein phiKMVp05 [Pseudomonas phage phiKMV]|uniref:Uncharacterized protein n=4 Tax=Phikmvvirus TaxID=477967 RepID=Q7Y2G0_BPKMV|nr:hypothetical protein phiKMVp05 [Pseudomonas phage phiKMV]YP_002117786.1 hypothetical protein PT2_gp07 [Pseudomonas phage PT2]AOZ64508.1 hypothetical protein BB757_008 [Pseudomonas phage vB_Pae-TbilisiM32]QHZ59716.1 hypothetical protein vBPaePPE3_007 [Pseudomonas phage vB_PaeP_PE3]ABY70972.1 conserved hypothetical phage protein [Pseudomonas phage PT2]CAD44196.1 hypothetical protein [Pseudomonas phage phiKMV]
MYSHDQYRIGHRVGLVNYSDRYLGADEAGTRGIVEAVTKPSRCMTVYHVRCEQTLRLIEAEARNMRFIMQPPTRK